MSASLLRVFQRYPLTCNISLGGTLAFFSDYAVQRIEAGDVTNTGIDSDSSNKRVIVGVDGTETDIISPSFSTQRCAAAVLFGAFYDGGMNTLVYRLYDHLFPHHLSLSTPAQQTPFMSAFLTNGTKATMALTNGNNIPMLSTALKKALVDNFVHSAFVYVPMFFVVTNAIKGRSFEHTREQLQQQYWPTCVSLWCFWLPFQFFNFALVPGPMRVAATNVACLWWTAWAEGMAQTTYGRRAVNSEDGERAPKRETSNKTGAPRGPHHLPVMSPVRGTQKNA